MALISIKNRLSVVNKRLLTSRLNRVDLYEAICNNILLWLPGKRFRLHRFSDLTVIYQKNTLIFEHKLYGL